jgi:hypothetical protein
MIREGEYKLTSHRDTALEVSSLDRHLYCVGSKRIIGLGFFVVKQAAVDEGKNSEFFCKFDRLADSVCRR